MEKQFVYKKGNAEIIIPFKDNESLKNELGSLPEIIEIISKKIPDLLFERKPKSGYEDLYRYSSDGKIELNEYPPSKIDHVLLVLFFKHPELMAIQQINDIVGISNSKDYINHKTYKKYFRKSKGLVGLETEGLTFVSTTIIPALRKKIKSNIKNSMEGQ